ncbi:MAG: hypothetical protein K0Q94_3784 [Paenibacillus sp.]|nr:hypothetical protein [Paenibacillus sp.]
MMKTIFWKEVEDNDPRYSFESTDTLHFRFHNRIYPLILHRPLRVQYRITVAACSCIFICAYVGRFLCLIRYGRLESIAFLRFRRSGPGAAGDAEHPEVSQVSEPDGRLQGLIPA